VSEIDDAITCSGLISTCPHCLRVRGDNAVAERDRLAEQYEKLKVYSVKVEQELEETEAQVAMLRDGDVVAAKSLHDWMRNRGWVVTMPEAEALAEAIRARIKDATADAGKWLIEHDDAVRVGRKMVVGTMSALFPDWSGRFSKEHDDAVRAEERARILQSEQVSPEFLNEIRAKCVAVAWAIYRGGTKYYNQAAFGTEFGERMNRVRGKK
jgi:hypothetical protein